MVEIAKKKLIGGILVVVGIIGIFLILNGTMLGSNKMKTVEISSNSVTKDSLSEDDLFMIEHCKVMPEMRGCDEYLKLAEQFEDSSNTLKNEMYDRSIEGLSLTKKSTVYEPANGETVELDAHPVKFSINNNQIKGFGYNGQIPGPLIKVKKGESIFVNFENNLDVETTVHWHGLRLENENDGVPEITQETIMPGKSFNYKLDFPDEGIYWYHPHVREDYQQELGLYGNILVVPEEEDYYNQVNSEELLILDDILIRDKDVYPFSSKNTNHALMGRFGNIMLINNQEDYSLNVKKGEVVRFYLTNVANVRPFNFVIENAKMKLVGSDVGNYEREEFVDSVVITPSERYIIEVYFPEEGTYEIKNNNPEKEYIMGKVVVSGNVDKDYSSEFFTLRENKYVKEDIDDFRSYFDKPVDEEISLTIDMPGMMGKMGNNMMMGDEHSADGIEWEDDMGEMNVKSTDKSLTWILKDSSGKKNMDINYKWKVGDKIKVRIFNDPDSMHPMQHPIHFHGQRFLVLEKDGVKNDNLVWKDTVLVPTGSTVDILIDVTNPGEWMAHCHIAEHLSSGMMTSFEVDN